MYLVEHAIFTLKIWYTSLGDISKSIAIKNSQLANSARIKYFSQQPCIIILSISVSWMFMVVFFSDSVKQKNSNADIDEAKASAFGAVSRIEYRLQTYSMWCLLFSQGCTNQSYLLDENEYSCAQFFLQVADYLLFHHNGIGARSFIVELAKAYQVRCWKISIIHVYNEHCIWTQWHKRILPLCKYWICLSAEKNCDEFLSQIYVIERESQCFQLFPFTSLISTIFAFHCGFLSQTI